MKILVSGWIFEVLGQAELGEMLRNVAKSSSRLEFRNISQHFSVFGTVLARKCFSQHSGQ